MRRLEEIEWEACFLPLAFDATAARRMLGFVPPAVHCLVPCPWLVHAYPALFRARLRMTALDSRLCDLVCLVVAQDNSCRYCYAASRLFLKLLGMPENVIRRLEEDLFTAGLEPRTATALAFAQQLSRANPPPGCAERRTLRDLGFSAAAIAELAAAAAVNVFYNRLCTLTAMPTARLENAGRSRLILLFRAVIRLGIRVGRRRMTRGVLAGGPVVRSGPFAAALERLEGLPVAAQLAEIIEAAWTSDGLTPRRRALVHAVVARALGCQAAESEAPRLLAVAGLSEAATGAALTRLSSPELDGTERVMVRLARESVWYRPVDVQRQAREACSVLGPRIFLECVGTAALANALCRLSMALADR